MNISTAKKSYLARVCGSKWLVLKQKETTNTNVAGLRLRCHSWLCPYCAPRRARKFAKAVDAYFDTGRLGLLTLTMDRHLPPLEAWEQIGSNWNRLLTLMRRDFGAIKFVRVIEPQPKSGYPHYHIIISNYIPIKWLKKYVASCGFGKIFDMQGIKGPQAKVYIRKYLGKAWKGEVGTDYAILANVRRISGSRGFKLSISTAKKWTVVNEITSASTIHHFGYWYHANFDNPLYNLVGYESGDDWVSCTLQVNKTSYGGLGAVFGLELIPCVYPK